MEGLLSMGLTPSSHLAKVYMLDWCLIFQDLLERATVNLPDFEVYTHALYVDDNNFATEELPPGARLKDGVLEIVEDEVEGDLEVEGDRRTAGLIQELANSICPSIQMTVDFPSSHISGWMPILDVEVRMREDKTVDWRHYRKPMASPFTILNDSAMPGKVKRLTLVQEGIRVLRNTRPSLHPEMKVGLLEDLAQRMRRSGYPEDYRRSVLEAAVGGYEGQVAAAERGEKPLYRPRGWQEATRRKKKVLSKASWYRPADFVLFVPATPGGKLASACREVLEEEGGRLQMKGKVVERGGVPLSRQLVQTDLAAGNPCSAPKCLPCTNGKKPGRGGLKHHRAGALYRGICKICGEDNVLSEYWGESGDSAYGRGLDHQEDVEKKRLTNAFAKHLNIHHPEREGDISAFEFNLVQNFVKPAPRQTAELVFIHNSEAEHLLNSRVDFEQPTIERVVTTREPREEQGSQLTGGGRGQGAGATGRGRGAGGAGRGRGAGAMGRRGGGRESERRGAVRREIGS